MTPREIGGSVFLGLLVLSLSGWNAAAAQLSRGDGDRLQRKIEEITKNGGTQPVGAKKTPVSEDEINSYLAFNAKESLPRGLTAPEITILGSSRLAGRVLVDIDEFKRHRSSRGFMDPLNYISGQVPVTGRGVLRTRGGKGRFQVESAAILGVPLPLSVVQELVIFFSRTPENPRGVNIDAPFQLPAKIREVVINHGEAVVVQ
jgi:hypothetical protein